MKLEMKMKKIALLIDGDNINIQKVPLIFQKAEQLGKIKIKRLYAISSKVDNPKNKKIISQYDIDVIKNDTSDIAKKSTKNSTDYFLMQGVSDILKNNKKIDIFCIASGDGDFEGMIDRIKENNKKVYGFGGNNSAKKLKEKCDDFFLLDNLEEEMKKPIDKILEEINKLSKIQQNTLQETTVRDISNQLSNILNKLDDIYRQFNEFVEQNETKTGDELERIKPTILSIVKNNIDEQGIVNLSEVQKAIKKELPDLKYKDYKRAKTSTFLLLFPEMEKVEKGKVRFKNNFFKQPEK